MSVGSSRPQAPVLIVDDEENVRSGVRRSLERIGFETVQAETGEQALELVGKQPFSCAITDLKMPGMGGHAFMRRCHELAPGLPIVVISGHGDIEDVIEAMRQGAADYLRKPYSDTELRHAVRRVTTSAAAPAPSASLSPSSAMQTGGTEPAGRSPEQVFAGLLSGEVPFPSISAMALTVHQLATSESGSANGMRDLIERDPRLTAHVLRLSNSGYYASYGTATTLHAAVARVGIREIGRLVDALIAKEFYTSPKPGLRQAILEVWERSWARAVCMRFLGQEPESPVSADQAYLTGLLCTIGFPVLIKLMGEQVPSMTESELIAFAHLHHEELGAALLESWGLPPECVGLARNHHVQAESRPGEGDALLRLYLAAEQLCQGLLDPRAAPTVECLAACEGFKLGRTGMEILRARTRTFLQGHPLEG